MKSDHIQMLVTAGQGYAAWVAASAEIGAGLIRTGAADSGRLAATAADALRAPLSERGAATEEIVLCAQEAQTRQLQAMRGAATLWSMAFLRHLDAARRR